MLAKPATVALSASRRCSSGLGVDLGDRNSAMLPASCDAFPLDRNQFNLIVTNFMVAVIVKPGRLR